jgi:uncharacterized RDD family membrane protein YckC
MQNPPPPPPPPGYSPPPPPPPPQIPSGYQAAPMAYATPSAYGGFWIRVVAYIIDAIILGIIGAILSVPLAVNYSDPSSTAYRTSNAIDLILSAVYFVGLWTYMGSSLGQRIFRMRVVDATTGAPVTLGKAVLRWLGLLLSFFVCFIGVIWVAFDSRKQGWMDKIAGTVVVQG